MNAAERRERLGAIRSKAAIALPDDVRETLLDLVVEVGFTSAWTDKLMMRAVVDLATVCLAMYGSFDPAVHLSEPSLAMYARSEFRHRPDSSTATIIASLRRVRDRRRPTVKVSRWTTAAPYTPAEWWRLEDAAASCAGWVEQAQLLLTLSGHAAMRGGEIAWAEVQQVRSEGDRAATIAVPNAQGEFRRVPVFGVHARRVLAAASRAEGFLFYPNCNRRSDAVSNLRYNVIKHRRDFADFKVMRARNTRMVELLQVPAPWSILRTYAGLSDAQTHYIGDLVNFIERADDDVVFDYFQRLEEGR